jgi:hypothetical protein
MEKVKILIPEGDKLLKERSAKILHKYKNGKVLVEIAGTSIQNRNLEIIRTGTQLFSGSDIQGETESRAPVEPDNPEETRHMFIEFIGPIDKEWLIEVASKNIEIIQFQPQNSYLAKGKTKDFLEVEKLPFVINVRPANKLTKRGLAVSEQGETEVLIICTGKKEEASKIIENLNKIDGVKVLDQPLQITGNYLRIKAHVTSEGHQKLMEMDEVRAVEEYNKEEPEDEVANLIICGRYSIQGLPEGNYLEWLDRHNLDGKGSCIAIVDQGIDTSHEAFKGRIKDLAGGQKNWHGTFVAGHAAGDYRQEKDAMGFIYGIGVAPKSDILAISNNGVVADPFSKSKLSVLHDGPNGYKTYIQNNSWGAGLQDPMDYGSLEAAFDEIVRKADPDNPDATPLIVCFSSGNNGARGLTRPKSAKNIIVTGNSENFRRDVGGPDSDNIEDVYQNEDWQPSSHGNCGDGRIRPHIVAPGEWTSSANFNSKPGDPEYISPKLTWGGGSSGASPKTAGACALIVQWWRQNNLGEKPSPAMVRALIINSAKPMASPSARPPVPSKVQGWGRLCLDGIFQTEHHHSYIDQNILLRNPGDEWSLELVVSDTSKPVKITLAWTDPPGNVNTGSSPENTAISNHLLLKVVVNEQEFVGNNFENGWSIPGRLDGNHLPDMDNTQNIFLDAGTIDLTFKITVEALNITTNCYNFSPLDPAQDFALVVDNAYPNQNFTPSDVMLLIDSNSSQDKSGSFHDGKNDGGIADYQSDPLDKDTPTDDEEESTEEENDWWSDSFFSWEAESQTREHPISETRKIKLEINSNKEYLLFGLDEDDKIVGLEGSESESELRIEEGNTFEKQVLAEVGRVNRLMEGQRQLSSVMVVSADSKFTTKAIDAIKNLAFSNEVYFLSATGAVLCFLASVLKENPNIKYILVDDARDMTSAITNFTYISTGGMQNLVKKHTVLIDNVEVITYHFRANNTDKKILIQVRFDGEKPDEIMLKLPGENEKAFNIARYSDSNGRKGIQVKEFKEMFLVKINPKEATNELNGIIEVYDLQNREIRLSSWSWSPPQISWKSESLNISTSNGIAHKQFIIELKANKGVKLKEMKVSLKKIESGGENEIEESNRQIIIKPQKRKSHNEVLDRDVLTETEKKELFSRSLYHSYSYNYPSDKVFLQLVKIEYTGEDSSGSAFAKEIYKNIIEVPSKVVLEHKKKTGVHYVSGVVKKLYYKNSNLKALRLSTKYGERDFRINEDRIVKQLIKLIETESQLHFGIEKDEVVSVIHVAR